jgi:hypothetical protein
VSNKNSWTRVVRTTGLLVALWLGVSACSATSWKEEVLLHDGRKVIVERTVDRGGRHEIGQEPPIKEQSLSFTLPGTSEKVNWEDKFSDDIGSANFLPKLLDIHKATVYSLAHPMGCLSYNKWGRPNPPYVIFKYQNKAWKRISLQDLPVEIKMPNLIPSSPDDEAKKTGQAIVSAEAIKKMYEGYKQPEYKTILREELRPHHDSQTSCPISSNAAAKLIAPEIDGKLLYYNWWPLAQDWLSKTYGK